MRYKLALFIFLSCGFFSHIFGQDATFHRNVKGILVLAKFNGLYDYKIDTYQKPIHLGDYFFPIENLSKSIFLNSNAELTIKNGYRVDFFSQRQKLKERAIKLNCVGSSYCYSHNLIYIMPVEIDFKTFINYLPFPCDKKGQRIRIVDGAVFNYGITERGLLITKLIKVNSF